MITRTMRWLLLLVGATWACGVGHPQAQLLKFSGYEWRVKSGDRLGPGPNAWRPSNVWVDPLGWLHLKIAHQDGEWICAEVVATRRLGFGQYQFEVLGGLDRLDRNVVLGLFNYPVIRVYERIVAPYSFAA